MIRNWQLLAKCRGDDPSKYEWSDRELEDEVRDRAERLCSGCPVVRECLWDSQMTHNITHILREARLSPRDEEDDIVVTRGVIRGGIPV
ncbi:WhiB family transcriptional regulator [Tsukamurella tyrosinosolvens]|uniref:WhiB family transcriptional regulator n=1 Tax=Tsukamurella tyrosinosolvens TaxID=57704 RepID=UPI0034628B9F